MERSLRPSLRAAIQRQPRHHKLEPRSAGCDRHREHGHGDKFACQRVRGSASFWFCPEFGARSFLSSSCSSSISLTHAFYLRLPLPPGGASRRRDNGTFAPRRFQLASHGPNLLSPRPISDHWPVSRGDVFHAKVVDGETLLQGDTTVQPRSKNKLRRSRACAPPSACLQDHRRRPELRRPRAKAENRFQTVDLVQGHDFVDSGRGEDRGSVPPGIALILRRN